MVILIAQVLISCNQTNKEKTTANSNQSNESLDFDKPDTLAFAMTESNNIIFKTVVNETDSLDLFMDTGGTELVMKHSAIKEKTSLLKNGKNKTYKEVNYEPLEGTYSLKMGSLTWDSLIIYPTTLLPKEADGHFGWNLFEDKIVELDYDKNLMIIHSTLSRNLEDYSKMEIEHVNTLICIKSSIEIGEKKYPNRYLFDLGFQRAVVLDKDLRQKSNFPTNLPVINESRLRNSEGTEFVNQVVKIDKICFGKFCAEEVPVQLFSAPNPARFETHILGNEILKRFNTILDFQNDFIYMKPNSLMELPYKDAS